MEKLLASEISSYISSLLMRTFSGDFFTLDTPSFFFIFSRFRIIASTGKIIILNPSIVERDF